MTTLTEIWSYSPEQLEQLLADNAQSPGVDVNSSRTVVALILYNSNSLDLASMKKLRSLYLKYPDFSTMVIKLAFEMETQEVFDDLNMVKTLQQYHQTKYLGVLVYYRDDSNYGVRVIKVFLYSIPDLQLIKTYSIPELNTLMRDFILENETIYLINPNDSRKNMHPQKFLMTEGGLEWSSGGHSGFGIFDRLIKFNDSILMINEMNDVYIYDSKLKIISTIYPDVSERNIDSENGYMNAIVTLKDKIIMGGQLGVKVYQEGSYQPVKSLPYKADFIAVNNQYLFIGTREEVIILANYQEVQRIQHPGKKMVVNDQYLVIYSNDLLLLYELKTFQLVSKLVTSVDSLLIDGDYLIIQYQNHMAIYLLSTFIKINSMVLDKKSIISIKLCD